MHVRYHLTHCSIVKTESIIDMQHINLRSKLLESTEEFCSKNLLCSTLESQNQALSDLIFSIARYQEEGVQLHPKVYLLSDVGLALKMLPGSDSIVIGTDPNFKSAVKSAVKKCAPLAINGWCIYVEASDDTATYGVFRGDTSPVALPIDDAILTDDVPFQTIKIHQITIDNVEVVSNNGLALNISLSHASQENNESQRHLDRLIKEVTSRCSNNLESGNIQSLPVEKGNNAIRQLLENVGLLNPQVEVNRGLVEVEYSEEKGHEQLVSYLTHLIGDSIKKAHGCLIAVSVDENVPNALKSGGICFKNPIDFHELVNECLRHSTEAGKLISSGQLVEGMLKSDGIILFSPNAKVLGFNFFVSSAASDQNIQVSQLSIRSLLSSVGRLSKAGAKKVPAPSNAIGGARTRAYETLSSMVGSELRAVFMQSQDGITYFKGTKHE